MKISKSQRKKIAQATQQLVHTTTDSGSASPSLPRGRIVSVGLPQERAQAQPSVPHQPSSLVPLLPRRHCSLKPDLRTSWDSAETPHPRSASRRASCTSKTSRSTRLRGPCLWRYSGKCAESSDSDPSASWIVRARAPLTDIATPQRHGRVEAATYRMRGLAGTIFGWRESPCGSGFESNWRLWCW